MMEFWILVGLVAVCWAESSPQDPYELCIENEDCKDPDNQCCVYHPKFGTEFGLCTPLSGLGAMCQMAHKHSRSYDYFCPCDDKLFECRTIGTWSTATNTKYDVDFCYTKNETKIKDDDKPNWHHPKPEDDDDSDRKHHHKKTHKDEEDDSDSKHHPEKDDDDDSDSKHNPKKDDDDSHSNHNTKNDDDDDSGSKHHTEKVDEDDSDRKHPKKHDDDKDRDSKEHEVLPPAAEDPDILAPEPEE